MNAPRLASLIILGLLTVLSCGACLPMLLAELNNDESDE